MFFRSKRTETQPKEETEQSHSFKGTVIRRCTIGDSSTVNLVVAVKDGDKVRNIEVRGYPLSHSFLAGTQNGDEVEGTYIVRLYNVAVVPASFSNYLVKFKNLTLDS